LGLLDRHRLFIFTPLPVGRWKRIETLLIAHSSRLGHRASWGLGDSAETERLELETLPGDGELKVEGIATGGSVLVRGSGMRGETETMMGRRNRKAFGVAGDMCCFADAYMGLADGESQGGPCSLSSVGPVEAQPSTNGKCVFVRI